MKIFRKAGTWPKTVYAFVASIVFFGLFLPISTVSAASDINADTAKTFCEQANFSLPENLAACTQNIVAIKPFLANCESIKRNLSGFAKGVWGTDTAAIDAFTKLAMQQFTDYDFATCKSSSAASAGATKNSAGGKTTTGGNQTTNPANSDNGKCAEVGLVSVNGICLPKGGENGPISGISDWKELANKLIDILLTIAGVIAVMFLIYGGFLYVTSGGNEETAEKGRKAMVNALIGLIVIVFSYAIVNVIVNLINKKFE